MLRVLNIDDILIIAGRDCHLKHIWVHHFYSFELSFYSRFFYDSTITQKDESLFRTASKIPRSPKSELAIEA